MIRASRFLLGKGDKPVSEKELRLLLMGAAEALDDYASSGAFDFVGHIDILKPIFRNIEKLMDITDAHKARKQ